MVVLLSFIIMLRELLVPIRFCIVHPYITILKDIIYLFHILLCFTYTCSSSVHIRNAPGRL